MGAPEILFASFTSNSKILEIETIYTLYQINSLT